MRKKKEYRLFHLLIKNKLSTFAIVPHARGDNSLIITLKKEVQETDRKRKERKGNRPLNEWHPAG